MKESAHDRFIARVTQSGSYGRCRGLGCVRLWDGGFIQRRRVSEDESGGKREHLDPPRMRDVQEWFCSGKVTFGRT